MTPHQKKLQSALIDIGKQAEKLSEMPDFADLDTMSVQLKCSIAKNDLKGIKKAATDLAAAVTKIMLEKS